MAMAVQLYLPLALLLSPAGAAESLLNAPPGLPAPNLTRAPAVYTPTLAPLPALAPALADVGVRRLQLALPRPIPTDS